MQRKSSIWRDSLSRLMRLGELRSAADAAAAGGLPPPPPVHQALSSKGAFTSRSSTIMSATGRRVQQAPALRRLAPHLRPADGVLSMLEGKKAVLIGESSHGTQEHYETRARISKRLIEESGFRGVCLEADFPEASSLHRFVMGSSTHADVNEAFEPFKSRFPVWMWRNEVMRDFVVWLRERNSHLPVEQRCGVFGLDLYSMQRSMGAVVKHLSSRDPEAAAAVKARYACLDTFAEEPQTYGMVVASHLHKGCRQAVAEARRRVVDHVAAAARPANHIDSKDEAFFAEINARVVEDAEKYYRSMFERDDSSWNVRDRHFADTLVRVRAHLAATRGPGADTVVVWAHNSHLGDAGATQRSFVGETNLGQLAREKMGGEVVNVGQFTYDGTVTAADSWGDEFRTFTVNPALPASHEAAMHELSLAEGLPSFSLDLRDRDVRDAFVAARAATKLERAIGVIYRPKTELQSHYFEANLPQQFDVAVFIDRTSALRPLDRPEEAHPRPGTPDLMESEEEEEEFGG